MKKITVVLLAVSTLFFTQCEIYREGCMDPRASNYDVAADIDDGCVYDIDVTKLNCTPHIEANLLVTNETDDVLYLYQELNGVSKYISCIGANAEDFSLHIPNQDNSIINLQVWKAEVVADENNPDISNVYRQWSVPLSSSTQPDEQTSWLITDNDQNTNSGTLLLSYPSTDKDNLEVIYHVDIFLNSKTGTRLASLQPGVSNKQVLEISNMSSMPLALYPGTAICQMIFERTEGKAKYKGKFAKQRSV